MLPVIQRIEAFMEKIEGGLLAALVLVMLGLAVYNVFYRNVLVPIQSSSYGYELAPEVEAPPAEEPKTTPEPSKDKPTTGDGDSDGFGGGFEEETTDTEGFGGGFGDEADPKDDEGGFGGGFGDEEEAPAESADSEGVEDVADEESGFGGGFGDEADPKEEEGGFGGGFGDETEPDEAESGFGGGFGDESPEDAPAKDADKPSEPVVEQDTVPTAPTQPTALYRFIDEIKLEWIDVLLRQLVLVVGFLGAMLAARRRKHITIDALSKVVPKSWLPALEGLTGALAAVICGFLAVSGWGLVEISLEYPKELMWWADESTFQMMFPIGFGLLAFHFSVRVLENGAQMMGHDVEIPTSPDDFGEEEE